MSNIGIAIDLAVLRGADAAALPGAIAALRAAGYAFAVWRGGLALPDAPLERALHDAGLTIVAAAPDVPAPEALERAAALGVPDLILPAPPGAGIAEAAAARGIRLAVAPAEGTLRDPAPLDALLAMDGLCIAWDTAALQHAGLDPAAHIRRSPGRSPLVFLGFGKAGAPDWDALFDAGEEVGAEWYVATAEDIESARAAYRFLAQRA